MKYTIVIVLIWACFNTPALAEAPEKSFEEYSVKELIEYIAPQFGQDPKLISKITWCESGHKVQSHDGGAGVNITGIHDSTFNGWLPKYEKEVGETLNIDSQFDQLKMMSFAFQDKNKRNEWTTYIAYTNGGEYTFTNKKSGKTFTVKCK